MAVILMVTERKFDKLTLTEQYPSPRKSLSIQDMIRHSTIGIVRGSDGPALTSLLSQHDDLSIGGPTWSVRFEFLFRE